MSLHQDGRQTWKHDQVTSVRTDGGGKRSVFICPRCLQSLSCDLWPLHSLSAVCWRSVGFSAELITSLSSVECYSHQFLSVTHRSLQEEKKNLQQVQILNFGSLRKRIYLWSIPLITEGNSLLNKSAWWGETQRMKWSCSKVTNKAEMSLITFNFLLKDVNVSVSVTNTQ